MMPASLWGYLNRWPSGMVRWAWTRAAPSWQLESAHSWKGRKESNSWQSLHFLIFQRGHCDGAVIWTEMKKFKGVWVENHGVNLSENQHFLKQHMENNIVTYHKDWAFLQTTSSIHHSFSPLVFFFLLHGLCYYLWLLWLKVFKAFFYILYIYLFESFYIKIVYWSDV